MSVRPWGVQHQGGISFEFREDPVASSCRQNNYGATTDNAYVMNIRPWRNHGGTVERHAVGSTLIVLYGSISAIIIMQVSQINFSCNADDFIGPVGAPWD
jgi:hypothetical protein